MFLSRRIASLLSLVLISACSTSPTSQPQLLLGSWGGDDAMLLSSSKNVHLQLLCEPLEFPTSLVLDATGAFVIPVAARRAGRATTSVSTLRGRLSGSTLQLELVTVRPDTTVRAAFSVLKDQAPTWRTACALGASN